MMFSITKMVKIRIIIIIFYNRIIMIIITLLEIMKMSMKIIMNIINTLTILLINRIKVLLQL